MVYLVCVTRKVVFDGQVHTARQAGGGEGECRPEIAGIESNDTPLVHM